jgi:DNA-binding LytR/AlgR family response regulator
LQHKAFRQALQSFACPKAFNQRRTSPDQQAGGQGAEAAILLAMDGHDGLEVARALAGQDSPPALVFVTAYDNFAVWAFDLDAVDYVLKPVAPERLQRSAELAGDSAVRIGRTYLARAKAMAARPGKG